MAVTPDAQRFARRVGGDVGEGIAAILSLLGLPGLISFAGGFPDPSTFPRERAAALLAEFAVERRDERVPVRADPRPRRTARRGGGAPRGDAGTQAGRRRAPDRERCDRSPRARLEDVPRRGRPRRDRSADVPGRDHGLPRLRRRARRGPDGRARAPGRRARAPVGGRCAPEAALHDPGPPEPGGREHVDGAPRAARRARAASRVPDRRGRRVPRARVRGRRAAEPLESRARTWSCSSGRRRRRSSPACGSAGPSGRRRSPRSSSTRSRTPTSAPARSGSGSSRSTSAAAGSRSSSRSPARSTGASRSACSPRSIGGCLAARRGRLRTAGSSRGSRFPTASTRPPSRSARSRRGVGIVPGGLFYADGSGADKVRLSFSMVDEQQIDEGIELLASLVRS